MKRCYKYIHFGETNLSRREFSCRNTKSGEQLGKVKSYPRWGRYCYFPTTQAVYSADCLRDIAHFLEQVNSGDFD